MFVIIKFVFLRRRHFVLMSDELVKFYWWERSDMGQSRSFDMQRLCVIMEDKCKPAWSRLSLLLFAEGSNPPFWADCNPLGHKFFRTLQLCNT